MCLIANISHLSFDQSGRSGRIELQPWAYLFFLLKITYYDIYESCSSSKLSGMRFIINSLEFPYLLAQCHKFPWNILNHLCLNRQKSMYG